MLVSIGWLRDFVEIPELSGKELGEKFTLATAEVDGVVETNGFFQQLKVSQILHIEKHPSSDHLNLVTFHFGQSSPKTVVCGAANVAVGAKVPYASVGVTLPGSFTLEPKKIRGVLSEGMLCSEQELGLSLESQGLMILDPDAPVGQTMAQYLKINADIILDIDNKSLTHRPDLWGHWGMAKEMACIFGTQIKDRFDQTWKKKIESWFNDEVSPIVPTVQKDSSCLGYYGLCMKGIEIQESPSWMKERLIAVGLRPINNIVDVSNYIMMELGIPMHIFDKDLIKDSTIHIKKINEPQEFVTLDEVTRKLAPGDTVICDSDRPLVLAGIMGGLNSGVNQKTKEIFIEVANWKPSEVRKTSTRLGLRTDSSARYEKSLDSTLLKRTLYRAVELVKELCPKAEVLGRPEYDGPVYSDGPSLVIKTSFGKINRVLGKQIPPEEVERILTTLGFEIQKLGQELVVTVPTYRSTKDIEVEVDLIEEVGRMIGYGQIPVQSPKLEIAPVSLLPHQSLHRNIKDFLSYKGQYLEVMTYPLVGEKLLTKASWPQSNCLKLANSISEDHQIMRPSLIPQALATVALNQKYDDQFKFFELGRIYGPDETNFFTEKNQILLAAYSKNKNLFMDVLDDIERLTHSINLASDFCDRHPKFLSQVVRSDWEGLHPFEYQNIRIMGKMLGVVFSIHPLMMRNYKMKGSLCFALMDLSTFENNPVKDKIKYSPLSKYPASHFDWTVVASKNTGIGQLMSSVQKIKIKQMQSVEIVDIFSMNEENQAITLRATFIDPEKTLSSEFIEEAQNQLIKGMEKAGHPLKV